MNIQNPHDAFFKELFSVKENVIDFIQGVFPAEIKSRIDFESLALDNNSYIDEELQESFSDIVYNCRYSGKTEITLSLLFEHKSYKVKYPHLQLLKYLLNIWQTNIKQNRELMPVIPIVVYHGKENWEYKSFKDYFKSVDNELSRFLPSFDYLIYDFSAFSNETIKDKIFKNITTKLGMLVMKNIGDEELVKQHLFDIIKISRLYFEEEKGLNFLETVIR